MFPGFKTLRVETADATITGVIGGSGPPLLLLHGYPETHVMWHLVAPRLAEQFTVVATDLRGYGDSDKPAPDPAHETYSKRAMARDQVEVMSQLGFDKFALVGHDRGARCAYRLALDHPHAVARLVVLDILPTIEHLRRIDIRLAVGYWHWWMFAQPADLPERFLRTELDAGRFAEGIRHIVTPEALAEYQRCHGLPGAIEAACEDYRAAVTVDADLDALDLETGRKIECSTLVLWGADGLPASLYDVAAVWRDWAHDLQGAAIPGGHHFPEESPQETAEQLLRFLIAT